MFFWQELGPPARLCFLRLTTSLACFGKYSAQSPIWFYSGANHYDSSFRKRTVKHGPRKTSVPCHVQFRGQTCGSPFRDSSPW